MIKLSIITINLNNADGLLKTITSLKNQSYKGFEYIIIDGCSSDDSIEIIRQNGEVVTSYISESDNGIYNAMNKGIQNAQGEFLLFLNSGDYLYNRKSLELLISNTIGYDIIYGNVIHENSQELFEFGENLDFLFFLRGSIGHGASIIRRELFNVYGLYNESNRIVSDWEFFFISIVKHNVSFKYINKIITCYQLDGISLNTKYTELQKNERELVIASHFPNYMSIINELNKSSLLLRIYLEGNLIKCMLKILYWKIFRKHHKI